MLRKSEYINLPMIKRFIEFMSDVIAGNHELNHEFYDRKRRVNVSYGTLESAFDDYFWAGKGYSENESILIKHKNRLRNAGSETLGEEVYSIFRWGRVISCWKWIEKQPSMFELKKSIEGAVSVLNSTTPDLDGFGEDGRFRMNSGFTKVYALYADDIIIYDGRVGAALGYLVTIFLDREGLIGLPDELRFSWKNGQSRANRDPSILDKDWVFPMMRPSDDKLHAKWAIYTNWILSASLKEVDYTFAGKKNQDALRAIEAALFMLGYDFPVKGVDRGAPSVSVSKNKKVERKTKKSISREIFIENKHLSKKEVIDIFVHAVGLTKNGASTYYSNFKTEKW